MELFLFIMSQVAYGVMVAFFMGMWMHGTKVSKTQYKDKKLQETFNELSEYASNNQNPNEGGVK